MSDQENGAATPQPQATPQPPLLPPAPPAGAQQGYPPAHGQPPAQSNGLATAALVLGIVGLLLFWTVWGGLILGALAIVFGATGVQKGKQGAPNQGLAVAGLVLGIITVVGSLLFLAFVVSVVNDAGGLFEQIEYCLDHPADPDC